jgi:hypothetical protein
MRGCAIIDFEQLTPAELWVEIAGDGSRPLFA